MVEMIRDFADPRPKTRSVEGAAEGPLAGRSVTRRIL